MFEFINTHGTFVLFWIEDGKAWRSTEAIGVEVWRYNYQANFLPRFEAGFSKAKESRIWSVFNPEKTYRPVDHGGSWRRIGDALWYVGATTCLVRLYERGTKMVCTNPCGEAWRPTEAEQREAIQALAPEWLDELSTHLNREAQATDNYVEKLRALYAAVVKNMTPQETALADFAQFSALSTLEPDIHWSFRAPIERLDVPRILREAREQGANEVRITCPGLKPMLIVHESVLGLLREYAVATARAYEEVNAVGEWLWLRHDTPLLADARKWRAQQKKLEYRRTTVVGTK